MPGRRSSRLLAIPAFFAVACWLAPPSRAQSGADCQNILPLESSSFYVGAEVASAYLGSSGSIYDTRPVFSQEAGWMFDFGEYGWIDGYFWIVSALHDKQHESHRMLFNEIETAIFYGQSWQLAEKTRFVAKVGPLWGPAIGYDNAHKNSWGPYVSLSLNNPVVVPYMSGLWIVSPKRRGRIRFGLRKTFAISDKVSLTPMAETVWMDRRRFDSRYGSEPEKAVFGGSFATMTTGAKVTWQVTDSCQVYFRLLMFDIINSQARRAVRNQNSYYAKCDWPVLRLGVEYAF